MKAGGEAPAGPVRWLLPSASRREAQFIYGGLVMLLLFLGLLLLRQDAPDRLDTAGAELLGGNKLGVNRDGARLGASSDTAVLAGEAGALPEAADAEEAEEEEASTAASAEQESSTAGPSDGAEIAGGCSFFPDSTASGFTFEVLAGHSNVSCLARCRDVKRCEGFVYTTASKTCWLKDGLGPPTSSPGSQLWPKCELAPEDPDADTSRLGKRLKELQAIEAERSIEPVVWTQGVTGPRQLCNYSEEEVRAMLAMKHSCKPNEAQAYYNGAWMKGLALARKLVPPPKEGEELVACFVACIEGQLACPKGSCLIQAYARRGESDGDVAWQMLVSKFTIELEEKLSSVLDAGANFGMGAGLFSRMFPQATVVSIEPSSSTFEMLRLNTARFRNIVLVHSGLWPRTTQLAVVQLGRHNNKIKGAWTIQVYESDKIPEGATVLGTLEGLSVPYLMEKLGLPGFDLVKIDVEGSERELLKPDPENDLSWLDRGKLAIVEVHEDMRRGARDAVRSGFRRRNPGWVFLKKSGEDSFYAIEGLKVTMGD